MDYLENVNSPYIRASANPATHVNMANTNTVQPASVLAQSVPVSPHITDMSGSNEVANESAKSAPSKLFNYVGYSYTDFSYKMLLLMLLLLALLVLIFQHSWNYVVPNIFIGVGKLNITQAVVMLILARIIFAR